MKINIKEKFDILDKLTTLSSELVEHQESKALCDRGIYEFKKGVNPSMLTSFIQTLNTYSWINPVDAFIKEYNEFLTANQVGLKLESILMTLEESAYRSTYENVITELNSIIALDESSIKNDLHKLDTYKFIPSLRMFLESYEKTAFAVSKTDKAEVKKGHLSPVMVVENGYVFNLNGVNYEVDNSMSELKAFEGVTDNMYNYSLRALSVFEQEANNTFVMNTSTGFVKIQATDEGANKFFIGENEFIGSEAIKNALKVTNVISYFDKNSKGLVEFMYENADKLANIEIVKNIKAVHEHLTFSFINLSNNKLMMNTVNSFERKNEMVEITADNIDNIKEQFTKSLHVDITPVLESIKVNVKAIEFAKLVNDLDISTLMENESIIDACAICTDMHSGFHADDKEAVKESFTKLSDITNIVESEKVKFVLENRTKFAGSDTEGKEKVLEMLNIELADLIKKKQVTTI